MARNIPWFIVLKVLEKSNSLRQVMLSISVALKILSVTSDKSVALKPECLWGNMFKKKKHFRNTLLETAI